MNRPLKIWVIAISLSLSVTPAAFASRSILDDFSRYPDASDGSPTWETSSIFWEVSNGEFVSRDVEREFALRKDLPPGREMSVETSLIVRESIGENWCVAGVCIYIDEDNFWHLALIKQPVSMGGQHYAELREMLDGTWIAEFQPETKLTQLDNFQPDFHWSFGRSYRLKIDLLSDRIVGAIFDDDGKLCFRQSYRFDNRAVTQGFPALDNGGFLARFDNFKVEIRREGEIMEKKREPRPAFNVAAYGDPVSRPTGYFRTERIDGRDWLITPDGRRFLILGTDHASYRGHWCEKLGYAPYHKKMVEAYGSEEKWAEDTTRMLRSWGFNALGAGHSEGTRYRGLAHTEFLSFGSGYAGHDDIVPKIHWTGFPNIFSPKFREYCEKRARDVCAPNADNPWLIGYFIDNELEWYGKSGNEWGLFEEAMKKPPEHTAKKALIELLRERHGAIDSLNKAWNTDFADWRNVSTATEVAVTNEMIADAMAFVALCADRYFGISAEAIRKYDPNHLILGARFAGRAPESAWRAAGRYCDIVSLNIYPRIDMETGVAQGVEEFLARCHELTGRPLFITEWSFPALDSGLPCRHGAGMRVDTQAQRAYCVAILQELFLRQPFVVGSDFFMWVDEPALGISSSFPEDSNYGLVNEDNQPYEKLVETLTQVHSVAYEIHEGKRDKSGVTDRLKPEALESILAIEQMPKGAKPVEFKRTPVGYEIDNGVLKMIKESGGGCVFDRIELSGVPVGDYLPMIWAKSPDNSWITPTKIAQVRKSTGEDGSLMLEVIAEREGTTEMPYRIGLSIVIPPATSWFASKLLWVENTGDSNWRLEGYLHYTRSNIGGDPDDDEVGGAGVPNYWLPIGAWYDRKLSIYYGVMSAPMSDMNVRFWKDEYGQHPDAVVPIRQELNAGARQGLAQPFAFIYAVRGNESDRPWLRVYAQIRRWVELK